MAKIVLVDCSVLAHKAIFSFGSMTLMKIEGKLPQSTFIPPVSYTYFSQIISLLKKIGIDKNNDTVICCLDGHSWRKNYDANYKAQRQGFRDSFKHINWQKEYDAINKINEQLNLATPFHFLRFPQAESDDIIATACKFFSNQTCIIVSIDADLQMLCHYPNVKYFSPMVKFKGLRGAYKLVTDPLKILADKCRLGDKSDNILVNKDTDTNEDYELRKFIIDLINLPEFVTTPILNELQHLPKKEMYPNLLPFWETAKGKPGLGQRLLQIYDSKDVITPKQCFEYAEKKAKRKAKQLKDKKKAKIVDKAIFAAKHGMERCLEEEFDMEKKR
jgi:hypothetical protein